jgi:hypothetical protein
MAYSFYVFERYDLLELARDVDEVIEDVPRERIVSITHSSATDRDGVRYSAFVVLMDEGA